MENDVAVYESQVTHALKPADLKAQVNLIQEVMRDVMHENVHYGKIPGCGDKPTLLKAGAEKLIMTFRLVPDIEEQVVDFLNGHREYRVKVRMYSQNQTYLGSGVGSCSTMEGKFRYRTGPTEVTTKIVPKAYWDMRKSDPAKAQEMIGGKGFTTKKGEDKQWYVAVQGEKVEHDNPADFYNTCLKMGKKRALVDALLTVTAASDIFTQDIEDMPEVLPGAKKAAETHEKEKPTADKGQAPKASQTQSEAEVMANPNQIKAINTILAKIKITDDLERHTKIAELIGLEDVPTSLNNLTMKQASAAIEKLQEELAI